MHDIEYESRAKAIAIQLINSRDSKNIATLKQFLSFIPNPNGVKEILIAAVLDISKTSVETTCWLLENPEPLQPEINSSEIITDYLSQKLEKYGLARDQHFRFNPDGTLSINCIDKQRLIEKVPIQSDELPIAIVRSLIKD